jgi:hypothetical protein
MPDGAANQPRRRAARRPFMHGYRNKETRNSWDNSRVCSMRLLCLPVLCGYTTTPAFPFCDFCRTGATFRHILIVASISNPMKSSHDCLRFPYLLQRHDGLPPISWTPSYAPVVQFLKLLSTTNPFENATTAILGHVFSAGPRTTTQPKTKSLRPGSRGRRMPCQWVHENRAGARQ